MAAHSKTGKPRGRPKGAKTKKPDAAKTGPKLAVTERLDVTAEVSRLSRLGLSTYAIADIVKLSQGAIQGMVKEVRKAYRETAVRERHEMVEEGVARLEELRLEAWTEYQRSKKDMERRVQESGENGMGGFSKEQLITEGRIAEARFLTLMKELLQEEFKLRDIYPEKKAGDTNINFMNLDWSAMSQKPKVEDPLQSRIKMLNSPQGVHDDAITGQEVGAGVGQAAPNQDGSADHEGTSGR